MKKWFDSLKSEKGPCCSDADGTALSDVDWESKDGHYRVRLNGQWIDVPDDALVTEPNLVGRTMVYHCSHSIATAGRMTSGYPIWKYASQVRPGAREAPTSDRTSIGTPGDRTAAWGRSRPFVFLPRTDGVRI